jgi:drug/metabolite transporter (DMT)-like permease
MTKWLAILIAFGGVLLIMQPNVAELGWVALLPLAAAISMAFMIIGNRAVAGAGSPLLMQFLVAAVAVPFILSAAFIGHFLVLTRLWSECRIGRSLPAALWLPSPQALGIG